MNENLTEAIEEYLKLETNYAAIISGGYGTGKTHYFKTVLTKRINKIPLKENAQKFYEPIHISLFGIKSVPDIQSAIFLELHPILKNRGIKLAGAITKTLARGLAQIHDLGDFNEYIADFDGTKEDWLNYQKIVICLDDFDRCSRLLDIDEVFGFINSLVENEGAKILIIANEEILDKSERYSSELREKVIGVRLPFEPETKETILAIINGRYHGENSRYGEFLLSEIEYLESAVISDGNNFRNLIYFFEKFRLIYSSLVNQFETNARHTTRQVEKLRATLTFSLPIAFEFKLGNIARSNIEEIEALGNGPFADFDINKFVAAQRNVGNENSQVEDSQEEKFAKAFKQKYFSKIKYYFLKSVFEHLVQVRPMDTGKLISELDNHFPTEDGKTPECEVILEKLRYLDCLELSDKAYKDLTRKMLEYVDSGQYLLQQYHTAFHYATRFENLMRLDLTKLKHRFFKGIKKGTSHYQYIEDIGFYITVSDAVEFRKETLEIVDFCISLNDKILEKEKLENSSKLIELFATNHIKFMKKITDGRGDHRIRPIWAQIGAKKVYRNIGKLSNVQVWRLANYFSKRYHSGMFGDLHSEKKFVTELRDFLKPKGQGRKTKNLKNASLNYLMKKLDDSLIHFPESEVQ